VRADRAEVAGLASWASLADVPGSVDIVLVLPGAHVDRDAIAQAARKRARAVWLSPGAADDAAADEAAAHGILLVRDRDIRIEQRHTEQVAGQPRKRGVHLRRRNAVYEDDRKRHDETGYVEGGGGGHKAGGGGHAILDEKKMVGGKPSPRRGPFRPPP
jgi:hypothetical protein